MKLQEHLDSSNADLHKQNVQLEEKEKEIGNLTNLLATSRNQTQRVQQEILKLQQEQIKLVKDLNEHKTMHNKIAEQLIQEEKKQKEVELQIKVSQDQVKQFKDRFQEQNMTLQKKDQTILDQRTHLFELNDKLNSHLKVYNET